jgi:nucleotide-binding universal stress UspA family protein
VFASQEHERLDAEGQDRLAAIELHLDGVAVEGRVRFGDLVEETALEADAFGAELIALGGRRRRWWHVLALGRMARRIARKATAPVMVLAC